MSDLPTLATAMQAGDSRAVAEFLRRYRRLAEWFAYRALTGRSARSDWREVAADVLADLAVAVATPGATVPASRRYVAMALRTRTLNAVRQAERRDHREAMAIESGSAVGEATRRAASGPWESLGDETDAGTARRAEVLTARLSADQIDIVQAKASGLTHREIAEAMGLTEAAVALRIWRTRRRARRALADAGLSLEGSAA